MAIGDRVRIDLNSVLFQTVGNNVIVYAPVLGPNGQPEFDKNNCVKLKRMGGVKPGSQGVIAGPPLRVHRSELLEASAQRSEQVVYGNDYVDIFPVMLDTYQQVGWFPIDHIKQFFNAG